MNLSNGNPSTAGLRVLLAEDGAVNQKIAVRLLERLGHGVTIVESGKAALDALRHGVFDLVLMDVEMPELDGLSATRAIRAHERHRGSRVPIIAVTTNDDADGCLAAGMDAYLRKPYKADQLHKAIEQVVRLPAA